jgi:hypothetical protein
VGSAAAPACARALPAASALLPKRGSRQPWHRQAPASQLPDLPPTPSPCSLLLASGGTDSAVTLYCRAAGRPDFELVTRLAGHENWVRGLAFTRVREAGGGVSLLLASASQDRYLRLWLVQQQGLEAQRRRDQQQAQDQGPGRPEALAQLITRYAPKPSFQAGSCR